MDGDFCTSRLVSLTRPCVCTNWGPSFGGVVIMDVHFNLRQDVIVWQSGAQLATVTVHLSVPLPATGVICD